MGNKHADKRIVVPGETPQDAAANASREALKLAQERLHAEDAKFAALVECAMAVEELTDTLTGLVVAITKMEPETLAKVRAFVARAADVRRKAREEADEKAEGEEDGHEG